MQKHSARANAARSLRASPVVFVSARFDTTMRAKILWACLESKSVPFLESLFLYYESFETEIDKNRDGQLLGCHFTGSILESRVELHLYFLCYLRSLRSEKLSQNAGPF